MPHPRTEKPRIWAEGRQHPPFEMRAFARASLFFARGDLAGLLGRCAAQAGGFGADLAAGRWQIPPHRLGRPGRWLPASRSIARMVQGAAQVLGLAGQVVLPPGAVAPLPQPGDTRRVAPRRIGRTAGTAAAPTAPLESDAALAAIRNLMAEPAPAALAEDASEKASSFRTAAAAEETSPAQTGWRREWLQEAAARGLGLGLLGLALPWGAARAGLAHWAGQDLRLLDQNGD